MEDNNQINTLVEEKKEEGAISVLKLLFGKKKLVILLTLVFFVLSLALSFVVCKPYYTASHTIMFRVNESEDVSNTDKVALAKKLIPSVVYVLKTSIVDIANKNVEDGDYISASDISSNYTEDSLLFTISYTDDSKEQADKKLSLLLETAKKDNTLLNYIQANEVSLNRTQNTPFFTTGTRQVLFVAVSTVLCFAIVCGIIVLRNYLDHSIREKEEIEELTGSNLIAYIEDYASSKEIKKQRVK